MERFRPRPCQPALHQASQLAKTEGESFLTRVGAEKSWPEELSGGEASAIAGKRAQKIACIKRVKETRKTGELKKDTELVEARCTPQLRPRCLVARSNQTWCHWQLNLDLKGGKGGSGGSMSTAKDYTEKAGVRERREVGSSWMR